MDSETLDGRLDIRLTCRSTGILSTKQKRKVPGLCTVPTSGCQSEDCVLLSGVNFANLKCQLVEMCNITYFYYKKNSKNSEPIRKGAWCLIDTYYIV